MPADNFSVRWSGQVKVTSSAPYTFYATTDDGVRLWIDGHLIIDKWVNQGSTEWSSNGTRGLNTVFPGGGSINNVPLPITGVYTIFVNPDGMNTGSMTLTLTTP